MNKDMKNLKDILLEQLNTDDINNDLTKDEYEKILDYFHVSDDDKKLLLSGNGNKTTYFDIAVETNELEMDDVFGSRNNKIKSLDIPWEKVKEKPNIDLYDLYWYNNGNGLNTILIDCGINKNNVIFIISNTTEIYTIYDMFIKAGYKKISLDVYNTFK